MRPTGRGVPLSGPLGGPGNKTAHHPGLRPAFGVSRSERETPFGASAERLTILSHPSCAWHRSARSCVTARRGFPAPYGRGGGAAPPPSTALWGGLKTLGRFLLGGAPSPK